MQKQENVRKNKLHPSKEITFQSKKKTAQTENKIPIRKEKSEVVVVVTVVKVVVFCLCMRISLFKSRVT